jgi:hypothetical protein
LFLFFPAFFCISTAWGAVFLGGFVCFTFPCLVFIFDWSCFSPSVINADIISLCRGQHYTPSLICALVAQETDDYFSLHGLPHPDALLFMDEEYYNRELESMSEWDKHLLLLLKLKALALAVLPAPVPAPVLEMTPVPDPPSHKNAHASTSAGHENGGREGSNEMDMDLGAAWAV